MLFYNYCEEQKWGGYENGREKNEKKFIRFIKCNNVVGHFFAG